MTAGARDRKSILAVAVLTSFASTLMLSAVTVALPAMGTELSMNAVQLGWITQAFALTTAIFALPSGRLADIWGRRKIFTIGVVIATISTLLAAFSDSFVMLVSLRVIQGLGSSMVYSTGVALLTTAFVPAERGRVIGINIAAIYLGLTLGPTLGGLLTHNLGWRSVFFLSIALQLPALVLLFSKVRSEWMEAKGERFDLIGSVVWAIMLFALIYGFSLLPETQGIWILSAGIIGVIVFVIRELRADSPIFNIRLLTRNRMFAFSNLTQLLYYMAIYPVPFLLSLYLQYVNGLSPQDAGFILLAQPFLQVIIAPISGKLSDRIQPRVLVSIGVVLAMAGLLLMALATASTTPSLYLIIVSLVLLGCGAALFISPTTNAIMTAVEKKNYGVASATDMTSRNVGMTISMSIVTFLFSLFIGTAQITPGYSPAFVESVRVAFIISSGLCFCSLLASVSRGKRILTT